jgi:N utilization substance protein B
MEVQKDFSPEAIEKFFSETPKSKRQADYLEKMCSHIVEKLPETDSFIESCSEKWKIGRICKIDLAVMRTAILEIMYMSDIPDSVSINEAVNIAKEYGTEDSGKFVNGVLGKVLKIKDEK